MQVNLPLYLQATTLGQKFALAAPGTTNYIFSGTPSPTGFEPHEKAVSVRVTVNLATAGKFNVGMSDGSTTKVGPLNDDTDLKANTWYTFTFEARQGITYDFKLGTDGVVNALFVSEVGGGIT